MYIHWGLVYNEGDGGGVDINDEREFGRGTPRLDYLHVLLVTSAHVMHLDLTPLSTKLITR